MIRINGKRIAQKMRNEIGERIRETGITPGLSVILVGDNPESHLYVGLKEKAAREVGIRFKKYLYDADTPIQDIVTQIRVLNYDPSVHGILIQLPLPLGIDENIVIRTMSAEKDVDGFHPQTLATFIDEGHKRTPVIVKSICHLIKSTGVDVNDKKAVILGNSAVFVDPVKAELRRRGMHVTSFAPTPSTVPSETQNADVVISALGRPKAIPANMIKDGAVVIDIGITKTGRVVVGDVDRLDLENKSGFITPTPGGVGPVTVAELLNSTLEFAMKKTKKVKQKDGR